MDLMDQLRALAKRLEKEGGNIATEKETRSASVLPFIQALGYDIFDSSEVLPDFAADAGSQKGEKVDFAVLLDDHPALLFQCTSYGAASHEEDAAKLRRSFHAASAQVGVLTNGRAYFFYSDRDKKYVMDAEPFLIIDLLQLDEKKIFELEKFSKSSLKSDEMVSAAEQLHYLRAIKQLLFEQSAAPSVDWVRFLARQVRPGVVTAKMAAGFTPIVAEAFRQFAEDYQVGRRMVKPSPHDLTITEEEFEGFFVVDVSQ